jgi:hypothetical protein
MKKGGTSENPYEAARKYLSKQSDIRCPFLKSNEESEPAKKIRKIK